MARLGDTASIFQLAFGLNAVLPSFVLFYRQTRASIGKSFLKQAAKLKVDLSIDDRDMDQFLEFPESSNAALRISNRLKWIPVGLCGLALLISFWGILHSAITPDNKVGDGFLWAFAVFSLILCPLAGIACHIWLSCFEDKVRQRNDLNVAQLEYCVSCFDAFLDLRRDVAKLNADITAATARFQDHEMKRKLARLLRKWKSISDWVVRLPATVAFLLRGLFRRR